MGQLKLFLVLLFWQGVYGADSIELDSYCPPTAASEVDCDVQVDIECDPASFNQTGLIYSPGYFGPDGPFSGEENKGLYRVGFKAAEGCGDVQFEIVLTEDDFTLMYSADRLSMGNGLEVGQQSFLSLSGAGGADVLGKPELLETTKGGQFWLELRVATTGGVSFAIRYNVLEKRLNETTLTDAEGNITSPGYFTNPTYPDQYEQHIIIDFAEDPSKEQQLILTVKDFSLSGTSGDYLLIGTGVDLFQDPNAVLLSWNVSAGRQFIIDGTKAHLVFQSFARETINNGTYKGYWITYNVTESAVTAPPPITTAAPTTPAPDYRLNSTVVVDLGTNQSIWFDNPALALRVFRERLAAVCSEYKSGLYNVAPADVKVLFIERCYDGWYVDTTTCMQVQTAVVLDADGNLGFSPSMLEDAVKWHGGPHKIAIPSQMTDVYFYAILAAVGVIIVVVLLLVILWRVKLQEYYRNQQKTFKAQSAKMEEELDRRNSSIRPLGALNSRMNPWKRGVENPNFVFDEDSGETALEYDPETGAAYPTSIFSWMNQPSSNFTKTPWVDDVNDSDTEIYSHATAPSVASNSASVSTKTVGSSTSGNMKRSILKKTSSGVSTAYDMIPPVSDKVDKFVDVPLNGSGDRHVYDVPAAVQVLDAEGRGSIGETYL